MSEINLDTNKSLKEIFQTIPIIYSRLYTGTVVNADGTPTENNTVIEIETGNLSWSKDGEAAYYIWVGPAQITIFTVVKIIRQIGPLPRRKCKIL